MKSFLRIVLAVTLLSTSLPAFAADAPAKAEETKDKIDLPAFPADATIKQVTHVAGKTLN